MDERPCCAPPEPGTVENAAGLDALVYRVGTWATFRDAMLVRLARYAFEDDPGVHPLQELSTRAPEDPAIALIDAFACAADVVTFYQERIANEGFLRTATERLSVVELARAIGYEPNPGVAANAWLAFTCDETEGAPQTVDLPVGLQIQSVPGPDELPQTFETIEEIEARPAWNKLRARTKRPQELRVGTKELWLDGVGRPVRTGDALLIVGEAREKGQTSVARWRERWDMRIVTGVEEDKVRSLTKVDLDRGLGWRIFDRVVEPAAPPRQIFALRAQVSLFGHNAPNWATLSEQTQGDLGGGTEWANYDLTSEVVSKDPHVDLDGRLPKIVSGSWAVFVDGEYAEVSKLLDTSFGTRSEYLVTGPYTRVYLDKFTHNIEKFDRRTTVAWVQSEEFVEGEVPIDDAVSGDRIELDQIVEDLEEDRALLVVGTDLDGEALAEQAYVNRVETSDDGLVSVIVLKEALTGVYERTSVEVRANVALATHGETRTTEVLGSGNGATTFQSFSLRRSPVTYTSAATPSGGETTLELRVNGVLWEPLTTLYDQEATTEGYVTAIDDDGVTTVQFGDGVSGARLPTGVENVTATYRTGLGSDGNVGAESLKLLKTRPLGLREVINPLAATGGADAEDRDAARANAPLTVRTLDRLVSRADYEDFARAYAGIAKARAVQAWSGERRIVHLTVSADDGEILPDNDPKLDDLREAIDAARDPTQQFLVGTHRLVNFRLEAEVRVDPDYVSEDVLADAEEALRDAYSFDARDLGQAVTAAGILAVLHSVDGVVGVDLNALYRTDASVPDEDATEDELERYYLAAVLLAEDARLQGSGMVGAELLLIDEAVEAVSLWETTQ